MEQYQGIDSKIQKGYKLILKNERLSGCEQWLEAWTEIKKLIIESGAKDIYELDKIYDWTQFISNYAQDLEMELHNAGIEDKGYHQKRIEYCRELLVWCGTGEQINSNTRRALAEAHFECGDATTGDRLFAEWLSDDPEWGWGYIGWSDCYLLKSGGQQYGKAEEILLTGYGRSELRDRIDLIERIIALYKDMGKPDKIKEYRQTLLALQQAEPTSSRHYKPTPGRVEKVGRNEPCPCGSGKKYKKCCGA